MFIFLHRASQLVRIERRTHGEHARTNGTLRKTIVLATMTTSPAYDFATGADGVCNRCQALFETTVPSLYVSPPPLCSPVAPEAQSYRVTRVLSLWRGCFEQRPGGTLPRVEAVAVSLYSICKPPDGDALTSPPSVIFPAGQSP